MTVLEHQIQRMTHIKQLAFQLQQLMRDLPMEDREVLKTEEFQKCHREWLIGNAWLFIYATNRWLSKVNPLPAEPALEKEGPSTL